MGQCVGRGLMKSVSLRVVYILVTTYGLMRQEKPIRHRSAGHTVRDRPLFSQGTGN